VSLADRIKFNVSVHCCMAGRADLVVDARKQDALSSFPVIPMPRQDTDNYLVPSTTSSNTALYVAWSDGRMGIPQPFEAHKQIT
jgi:hypothetical protein